MQRFFVDKEAYDGSTVTVVGADAYHISRSLRMKSGEKITACLPDGTALLCELATFSDEKVVATVLSSSPLTSEPPCRIHIYQALPKGDKLETVVQKSVECGAYSITPFVSERCIAKVNDNFNKKLERLNRISYEAAKQCGRNIIPEVCPPLTYKQMLGRAAGCDLPLFCYEAEGAFPLGNLLKKDVRDISVIIGSEGGFSPDEAALARESGMLLTGLGPRILRCETASTFVLSALSLYFELGI